MITINSYDDKGMQQAGSSKALLCFHILTSLSPRDTDEALQDCCYYNPVRALTFSL